MRNRVFKAMCKVPMNLQLFAEGGDGAGAGEGNGGGSGEGTGGEGGDNPPSFDDFLKTGSNQAEFDRRDPEGSQYGSDKRTGEVAGTDG